jgi:hypothetical protein
MAKLSHQNRAAERLDGNLCLTKANAAIGATASAVTTGNAITTMIDGILRTVGALTNQALVPLATADFVTAPAGGYVQPSGSLGFYVQPANTTVYYVLCANAAGTPRVVQGTFINQPLSALGISSMGDGSVPDTPDGWVAFAMLRVTTTASTFTPGTTALTGLATVFDVGVLPAADRP